MNTKSMFDKMKPETKSVIQKLIDGRREVTKSDFYNDMAHRNVHPNVTFLEGKYGVSVFHDCTTERKIRGVNISFCHDYSGLVDAYGNPTMVERYYLGRA